MNVDWIGLLALAAALLASVTWLGMCPVALLCFLGLGDDVCAARK